MDSNNEVVYLYLDDIIPNRFQPREVFDDQALKESISEDVKNINKAGDTLLGICGVAMIGAFIGYMRGYVEVFRNNRKNQTVY